MKSSVVVAFLTILLVLGSCVNEKSSEQKIDYFKFGGKTMGTTYSVIHGGEIEYNLKYAVDSILVQINNEVSTYIDSSTISKFNQTQDTFDLELDYEAFTKGHTQKNQHFFDNLLNSKVVHEKTSSFFDPTIMPLVNYWGFGYSGKKPISSLDSVRVDSIKRFVGFENVKIISLNPKHGVLLLKSNPEVELDFSGIAKGYAVDEIASFLEENGINNYLVEIGGETITKGKNSKGTIWSIGINTPSPEASMTDFQQILELKDKAIATSGNYRQFYEIDGRKYSHIINPKTGYSEKSDLLSVSVLANSCIEADGFATAFFVMGLEEGLKLAQQLEEIEALFIFGKEDGNMEIEMTPGFEKIIKN